MKPSSKSRTQPRRSAAPLPLSRGRANGARTSAATTQRQKVSATGGMRVAHGAADHPIAGPEEHAQREQQIGIEASRRAMRPPSERGDATMASLTAAQPRLRIRGLRRAA